MKKTKLTRSLLAACSIVALSAVMYGCTHSGGPSQDDLDAANEATATAEAEAKANADAAAVAVQAKADADAAAEVARLAQEEADAAAEEARLAQVAAEAQSALDAQAKIDADAAAAEAEEDARIAQEAADAALEAQMKAEEEAAAAVKAREDAEKTAQDLEDEATAGMMAAHMAKVRRLSGAIQNGEHASTGDDAGILAIGDMHTNTVATIAVTATPGAPAAVTVTHGEGDALVTVKPAFAVMGTADEVAAPWTGTRLTRTDIDASHTHEMTVYTDVAATDGIPFSMAYVVNSAGALDIPTMANPGHDANIMADAFTNTNFVAHAPNMDDGSDPDSVPNNYVGHRGTYAGAEGEFRCTDAGQVADMFSCTSRLNSLGQVLLDGTDATWTFVPDTGAMAMIGGTDYVWFGWWLRENLNPAENTQALAVRTFYGSIHDVYLLPGDDDADVDITGTASFEGAAAGKVTLVDDVNGTAAGGHFTAAASLTADFANTDLGTISGEISGFSVGGNAMDWNVALLTTPLISNADSPDDDAFLHFNTDPDPETQATIDESDAEADEATVWTMGSGDDARAGGRHGNWWGTFYVGARNDGSPGSAAGEFFAEFGEVGNMVGAFGASNVTADTPSN